MYELLTNVQRVEVTALLAVQTHFITLNLHYPSDLKISTFNFNLLPF